MSLPRLLVLMGSGETTPSLSATHRQVFDRLGPVEGVILDTPYGFQENADIISAKAIEYFHLAAHREVKIADFRSQRQSPLEIEEACAHARRAGWVFAGPGSPSYVLRQWQGSPIVPVLLEKLQEGGALVFASAAACILGRHALPVYEIYKVGEEPHWLPGLDLLSSIGLPASVLPHYNNKEGGNHDTRFCYMGERRLIQLEAQLEGDDYILGLDEHTALILDLDAGTAEVTGKGGVTVRQSGRSTVFTSGSRISLSQLRPGGAPEEGALPNPLPLCETLPRQAAPLLEDVHRCERDFRRALQQRQGRAALACLLEIEQTLCAWAHDTDVVSLEAARSLFRGLLVELGEAAQDGLVDPAQRLGPFVEAMLEMRRQGRERRDWGLADQIRDRLISLGIEIHDTAAGTHWNLLGEAPALK